jgi:hypothetical protein
MNLHEDFFSLPANIPRSPFEVFLRLFLISQHYKTMEGEASLEFYNYITLDKTTPLCFFL